MPRLAFKMEATAGYHPPLAACASLEQATPPAEAADDALVARALAGAPEALDALAERYRPRVYAFALAMLRHPDNAEDVAQETLMRAFSALRAYRCRGQFRAWLFRIAGNLCRDRQRRGLRREIDLESLPAAAAAPDPGDAVTLRTVVFAAVRKLPETYRGPVMLHYMEGLSVAETAAALGRTQTAVRVQLWRARARLARELSGACQEETR
jgi:RNA polymerase sigma-70 factor (ECF subfamily)